MEKEVSKEEFYKRIYDGNLDVHPTIATRFPYTSIWKYPRKLSEPAFGRTVDRVEAGQIKTRYFVNA